MVRLLKSQPEKLKSLGLNERWLQDRVSEDPSLIGLGDLHIIQRERAQPTGGRIDFLMFDPESETRYEIEIMLGAVDESHIIRTIEYWDIERQRYPTLEHRAVIIAEEITSRFFNVIRLLNRAVPIIAIQLSAFKFEDSVVLHFTKVLDVYEYGADDEEIEEQVDRAHWERTASANSLAIVDKLIALMPTESGRPRVTYNKGHIAVGTTGRNFCWFLPRQKLSHCFVHLRVGDDGRDTALQSLDEAGISATPHHRPWAVRFKLVGKEVDDNIDLLKQLIIGAEARSR